MLRCERCTIESCSGIDARCKPVVERCCSSFRKKAAGQQQMVCGAEQLAQGLTVSSELPEATTVLHQEGDHGIAARCCMFSMSGLGHSSPAPTPPSLQSCSHRLQESTQYIISSVATLCVTAAMSACKHWHVSIACHHPCGPCIGRSATGVMRRLGGMGVGLFSAGTGDICEVVTDHSLTPEAGQGRPAN